MIYVVASIVLIVSLALLIHSEALPWARWMNYRPNRPDIHIPPPNEPPFNLHHGMRWIGRLTPFVFSLLVSTLIEISRFANQKEKETINMEKEKLETELKFLKSQVNPHFLFNALNNIYSLTLTQNPQASESVMQLSEILRYMVYDSNENKVHLKNEITYIENFVKLKMLKDSRGMDVQLDIDNNSPNLMVAPLLFIPFVENAFKHSRIEDLKEGFIRISLKAKDQTILFEVENSIPNGTYTKDKEGGVGLTNIRKRLKLLYPDDEYDLNITQTETQFDVSLKLLVV